MLFSLFSLGYSSAAHDVRVPMEGSAFDAASSPWAMTNFKAPRADLVELTFMVKQQNVDELEKTLLAVSDPASPSYGRHLSNAAVHELVKPRDASIEAVKSFIASHGAQPVMATPNGDMISATVTFEKAEAMLNAEYMRFEHRAGTVLHRTLAYSLPAAVAEHVDLVAPTVHVPAVRAPKQDGVEWDGVNASNLNTPKVLRKLYSVNDAVGGQAKANKQAVTGFLEQYYNAADFAEFNNLFMKENIGMKIATAGDAPTGSPAGTESMLDAEYMPAMGAKIATEFWGYSGRAPGSKQNEPFLKWLEAVANASDDTVPKVFSTSYGEDEDSVEMSYALRINAEFMKAGARGISLLFASGDSGAAGDTHTCKGGKFVPQWPSGSPYVTAVGGTSGGGLAPPESAAAISSGGFSNRWAQPAWQKDAVAKYLTSPKLPDAAKYNATGRGFPDISAQAMSFVIVTNKVPLPGVSGTSCASPTAAGVFGLLNDARLAAGKSTLGFLNPFIYGHAAAFNDCTTGSNLGCLGVGGFPAVTGWDAVTGVGTPNYEALKDAALKQAAVDDAGLRAGESLGRPRCVRGDRYCGY